MRTAWLVLCLALSPHPPTLDVHSPSPGRRGGQGVRTPRIDVIPRDAERRVDILVDGQPFTSYIYPTTLKKPILYPLRTASGKLVTRGWPLEPRPGERVDHPHQVGLWFTHGDVNGLDFWNNSDAIPAARPPAMGTIVHRAVRRAAGGMGEGVLEVTADWVDYQGKALLREDTRFVFRAGPNLRAIDRITTLTALGQAVTFTDNKEGLIGLRVARPLDDAIRRRRGRTGGPRHPRSPGERRLSDVLARAWLRPVRRESARRER